MPGRILNALKTVGVKNPVILLDEVDKMVIFRTYFHSIATCQCFLKFFWTSMLTFIFFYDVLTWQLNTKLGRFLSSKVSTISKWRSSQNVLNLSSWGKSKPEKKIIVFLLLFCREKVFMATPLQLCWKCWILNRIGRLLTSILQPFPNEKLFHGF